MTSIRPITVAEALERCDEVTKGIEMRNISRDQEIAGRIAVMLATGQAIDPDCVPTGYYIRGNTMMTVDGHPVAIAGHGAPRPAVDSSATHLEAVNRSVAHLEGASL